MKTMNLKNNLKLKNFKGSDDDVKFACIRKDGNAYGIQNGGMTYCLLEILFVNCKLEDVNKNDEEEKELLI